MLKDLSGKTHQVLTAITIIYGTDQKGNPLYKSAIETTEVEFAPLTDDMINAYIITGEPLDKAGGYGYQSLASAFIPRINGCYYNVVGTYPNSPARDSQLAPLSTTCLH